jgi:phosphatidylglycerophosphate synthase
MLHRLVAAMRGQLAVFMTTGRILNIPNILTLARIALIPVFFGCLLAPCNWDQ